MKNSKAKEIANGYSNLLKSKFGLLKDEQEVLFSKRMEICNLCVNNKSGSCALCGCILVAKTKSIYSECPDGLW